MFEKGEWSNRTKYDENMHTNLQERWRVFRRLQITCLFLSGVCNVHRIRVHFALLQRGQICRRCRRLAQVTLIKFTKLVLIYCVCLRVWARASQMYDTWCYMNKQSNILHSTVPSEFRGKHLWTSQILAYCMLVCNNIQYFVCNW